MDEICKRRNRKGDWKSLLRERGQEMQRGKGQPGRKEGPGLWLCLIWRTPKETKGVNMHRG